MKDILHLQEIPSNQWAERVRGTITDPSDKLFHLTEPLSSYLFIKISIFYFRFSILYRFSNFKFSIPFCFSFFCFDFRFSISIFDFRFSIFDFRFSIFDFRLEFRELDENRVSLFGSGEQNELDLDSSRLSFQNFNLT
jgi:hypothetical protein